MRFKHMLWKVIKIVVVQVCPPLFEKAFATKLYTLWAVQCTSKVECNQLHSYISLLPITAFILIRNIPGYLRSNYSSFFAWFGQISLELFIGQYHIWLSADTTGVLVLTSPSWPTVNIVLSTFIFVCAAHEISRITGLLSKCVLGSPKSNNRDALTRFLVMIGVVIAVAAPASLSIF